jgi:uncharacterized protein (DUF697 family)
MAKEPTPSHICLSVMKTLAELDRLRADCKSLVTQRSLMSAGVSVIPIPGIDLLADVGLLTTLLPAISAKFGLDHEQVAKLEPQIAQKIFVLAASMENSVIGRMVSKRIVIALLRRVGTRVATASVAKYVPLLGSALAAGVSFGAMKLVGDAHVEDCYKTALALMPGAPDLA